METIQHFTAMSAFLPPTLQNGTAKMNIFTESEAEPLATAIYQCRAAKVTLAI